MPVPIPHPRTPDNCENSRAAAKLPVVADENAAERE